MIRHGVEQVGSGRPEIAVHELYSPASREELRRAAENRDVVVCGPSSVVTPCLELADQRPDTQFLLIGAYAAGRQNVVSIVLNRREHGFIIGYAAALLTDGARESRDGSRKAAVLYDQAPSLFANVASAALTLGFRSVQPRGELLIRPIPERDTEALTEELSRRGVSVAIVYPPASGEPAEALYSALRESGISIVSPYGGNYAVQSERLLTGRFELVNAMAEELQRVLDSQLLDNGAKIVDVASGHIGLDRSADGYESRLSASIRAELDALITRLERGELVLSLPGTPSNSQRSP